jgi:hypothetical protein
MCVHAKPCELFVGDAIRALPAARQGENEYQRGLDAGREEAAKIAETFKGGYSVNHVDGLLEPDPDGPWCLGGDVASAIRSRIGKGVEDGE